MNKNKTFLAAALVALAASLPVHAATDYTRTRYPIVLSHGLFGFKSVGPVDYWHAIVRPWRRTARRSSPPRSRR